MTEQLTPPGDGSAQVIPDFTGETTQKVHKGHRIWLPDQVQMPAAPTPWMTARGIAGGATLQYSQVGSCKLLVANHGIGNDRATNVSSMATGCLQQIKTAITAGQIDPLVVVFPQGMDPDDPGNVDLWGNNAADGSYPFETMLVQELIPRVPLMTVAEAGPANCAMLGFSRGGMVTACMRAIYDVALCAAYAVMGAPRTVGDFPNKLQYFNNFAADEKLKCFGNEQAACVARSAITSDGLGLFDQHGAGTAPLRLVKSSADLITIPPMNQLHTRLTASGIAHAFVDVGTALHSVRAYFNADAGATLAWIRQQAGW